MVAHFQKGQKLSAADLNALRANQSMAPGIMKTGHGTYQRHMAAKSGQLRFGYIVSELYEGVFFTGFWLPRKDGTWDLPDPLAVPTEDQVEIRCQLGELDNVTILEQRFFLAQYTPIRKYGKNVTFQWLCVGVFGTVEEYTSFLTTTEPPSTTTGETTTEPASEETTWVPPSQTWPTGETPPPPSFTSGEVTTPGDGTTRPEDTTPTTGETTPPDETTPATGETTPLDTTTPVTGETTGLSGTGVNTTTPTTGHTTPTFTTTPDTGETTPPESTTPATGETTPIQTTGETTTPEDETTPDEGTTPGEGTTTPATGETTFPTPPTSGITTTTNEGTTTPLSGETTGTTPGSTTTPDEGTTTPVTGDTTPSGLPCTDCCAPLRTAGRTFYIHLKVWYSWAYPGVPIVDVDGITDDDGSVPCTFSKGGLIYVNIQFCQDISGQYYTIVGTKHTVIGDCTPLNGHETGVDESGNPYEVWWNVI